MIRADAVGFDGSRVLREPLSGWIHVRRPGPWRFELAREGELQLDGERLLGQGAPRRTLWLGRGFYYADWRASETATPATAPAVASGH